MKKTSKQVAGEYLKKRVSFFSTNESDNLTEQIISESVYSLLVDLARLDKSYIVDKQVGQSNETLNLFNISPQLEKEVDKNTEVNSDCLTHFVKSGVCVVFVNDEISAETFGFFDERRGTAKKLQIIKSLFSQLPNFRLHVHRNPSARSVLEKLGSLTSTEGPSSNYDCVISIHLGIGFDGIVFGSDGTTFSVHDLLQVTSIGSQKIPCLFLMQMTNSCTSRQEFKAIVSKENPCWSRRWCQFVPCSSGRNQLIVWICDPFPLEELLSIWQASHPSRDIMSDLISYLNWARSSNKMTNLRVHGSLSKLIYIKV